MPIQTAADSISNSAGSPYGFKNRIINGAMVIDQRNAGAAVTVSTSTNTFPVDRMALISVGATTTAQRVEGTGAYSYDVLYTGAASVTASYFFQRIESVNCFDLVNKNVTFQVQLSSSTVTSVAVGLFSAGSTDNFASPVSISSTTFTITSTPTIYTWTVNAGANAANGLQIQLNFGAFTSGTARISGMQLEKGTQATTFDYRPHTTELLLCKRYCHVFRGAADAAFSNIGLGMCFDSTGFQCDVPMPVQMRVQPTVTYSDVSHLAVHLPGLVRVTATAVAMSTTQSGPSSAAISITTTSNGNIVSHKCGHFEFNNSTTGWLALASEL